MLRTLPSAAEDLAKCFTSDNVAGASPEVLAALAACNDGAFSPYGTDLYTRSVEEKLKEVFECDLSMFLVPTGTAANALCLAAMSPPWGSVICHASSHINTDECGAPEFFSGGGKLISIDGQGAKLDPVRARIAITTRVADIHSSQPSCVSITQATEFGSVYSLDEIGEIGDLCRSNSVRFHMDGSRFANALVSLGCSPAQMTWKAGVEALSFGATKNGTLAAEAIVLFDRTLAIQMAFRRKRAGHLLSKMRFLSAQFDAYLADDLWLRNARQSNRMAQRLVAGIAGLADVEILDDVGANIVFCRLPSNVTAGLLDEGFQFLHDRWAPGVVRFVTSFVSTEASIDQLVARIAALVRAQQKR